MGNFKFCESDAVVDLEIGRVCHSRIPKNGLEIRSAPRSLGKAPTPNVVPLMHGYMRSINLSALVRAPGWHTRSSDNLIVREIAKFV